MPVPLADICHSSDPATRAGCFELAAALIAALLPRLSPGRARLLLGNTGESMGGPCRQRKKNARRLTLEDRHPL